MTKAHLQEYVDSLEIVDTHEHLPPFENQRKQHTDVIAEFFSHYASVDIVTAGFDKQRFDQVVSNSSIDVCQKWKELEPFWEKTRFTGYGRSLTLAARDIYGVENISRDTIEELNNKFLAIRKSGCQYSEVLKKKSKIQFSILDTNGEYDKTFFKKAFRMDYYTRPHVSGGKFPVSPEKQMKIGTFTEYLEECRQEISAQVKSGAVALKLAAAYNRPLNFAPCKIQEAEKIFYEYLSKGLLEDPSQKELQNRFEDFMVHYILNEIKKYNLPVQVHTGLLEGNGNILSNSNPSLLNNLFLQYPEIDFILMHIGYPYFGELGALAKMFSNVFIDMAWSHIISPNLARTALNEWLDLLPTNKIAAFGGDYLFADGVYAHQKMARKNVTCVLWQKIEEGILGMDDAKQIAKRLFIENPLEMFHLK